MSYGPYLWSYNEGFGQQASITQCGWKSWGNKLPNLCFYLSKKPGTASTSLILCSPLIWPKFHAICSFYGFFYTLANLHNHIQKKFGLSLKDFSWELGDRAFNESWSSPFRWVVCIRYSWPFKLLHLLYCFKLRHKNIC